MILDKEEQAIDETIKVGDTDTTDDPSEEELCDDTKNASGTDTKTDPSDGDSPPSVAQHLLKLEELFTGQIARNQNQKQMFDAIYREMTSYKENALLEAFHKPVIHNLIQLYDNLEVVESQLKGISETFESLESQIEDSSGTSKSLATWFGSLAEKERNKFFASDKELTAILDELKDKLSPSQENTELKDKLSQFQANLENVRYELEEVLYRMDVTRYEEHPEKLDQKLHKTLKTTPTDDPDKDREVVEIHKTGFYWREKVFRPEEVTIFRYTQPAGKSEEPVAENPKDEKGDETDG